MTDVRYSYGIAIRVRVLGPTNTHVTQLKVWRSDATYKEDANAVTLSWDHALNGSDNAVKAVETYLAGIPEEYASSWVDRTWTVAGAGALDYIAVAVPK